MNNGNIRERNIGLDILKCICAFFVITIHCKRLPGPAGDVLTALNRTAVPVFFMITGFFYQRTVDSGRVKSQIIKILKLTFWANLFYFIYTIITLQAEEIPHGKNQNICKRYIKAVISGKNI